MVSADSFDHAYVADVDSSFASGQCILCDLAGISFVEKLASKTAQS